MGLKPFKKPRKIVCNITLPFYKKRNSKKIKNKANNLQMINFSIYNSRSKRVRRICGVREKHSKIESSDRDWSMQI